MQHDLLETLNEEQRRAVLHPLDTPAMVIAGAGSGKTRVLTTRVAHLIAAQKVRHDAILLLTFTNKAAQEMTTRVERITGEKLPFSGTFHRLSAQILRRHGPLVGLSHSYTIYDDEDQLSLMTALIKESGFSTKEIKARVVLSMISEAKNALILPKEYAAVARGKYQEIVARLYPAYQHRLEKNDAVDFDDLLGKTVELLEGNPQVTEAYRQTFEHILIDEYQDTNGAQLALTKLLLNPHHNLYVVGDFAQAIYSWRGADYRNMLALRDHFKDMIVYELSQNYRSTQVILDAASSVIANNTTHPVLALWTDDQGGEKISLVEGESDREEVGAVVKSIAQWLRMDDEASIAVLYRTNAQSRAIEEGLLAAGIPYRLIGGVRFYARKEIKDVLALLRLWLNPDDEVAKDRLTKLGKRKAASYLSYLGSRTEVTPPLTPAIILETIFEKTQYLSNFDEHDEDDRGRLENIAELRSVASQYDDLTIFLETVALVEEEALRADRYADRQNNVLLMSIHAAKGLEFDHVFIIGLEEGLFPHSRALMDKAQMEEERRLFYVALTRAKKTLLLSFARRRLLYGRVSGSIVSRFLSEIPSTLIKSQRQIAMSSTQDGFRSPQRPISRTQKFIPFDDPSIDDFLDGSIDIDAFLKS